MSPPRRKARYSTRGPRCFEPRRTSEGLSCRVTRLAIGPRLRADIAALQECLFHQRRRIEDQRHPLIAELGRAGETFYSLERRAERFDDDVLLTDELVDDQTEPSRAYPHHHGIGARAGRLTIAEREELVDTAERKGGPAQGHHFLAFHATKR